MEKILFLTLLYDFYSELLTDKQKLVFKMYYLDDFTMTEIAEIFKTTRQSVNDLLKRTEKILERFENNLNLVNNYVVNSGRIKAAVEFIDRLLLNGDFNHKDLLELRKRLIELE